jgi:hypothetical protein
MSSLGQLSSRLDRHLQVVGELTKAVLALRADLMCKLDVLKVSCDDVSKARAIVLEFLTGLVPTLKGTAPGPEEHRVILERLAQGGEQPSDWAEDFGRIIEHLQSNAPVDAAQLDKLVSVIGYLEGELAEDVRRLRSR